MDSRIIEDLTRLRNMLSSNTPNLRTHRELYKHVMNGNLDTTATGRVLLRNDVRNTNRLITQLDRSNLINRIDTLLDESRGDGMVILRSTDRRFL